MEVKIECSTYEAQEFSGLFQELEMKSYKTDRTFSSWTDFYLKVSSFDEIISILQKYRNKIDISLGFFKNGALYVDITKHYSECDLGNQVD